MNKSEFWNALEQVFGTALGRSLAHDLHLSKLGETAEEALERGTKHDVIWHALIDETGMGEDARWVHRRAVKKR